jgi:mannonate dehydratase
MPTVQDHIALDGLTDGNLSTLRAIGVDDIAIMHPEPPQAGQDQSGLWRDVRAKVETHGMRLNNVGLRPHPSIPLGRDDRDAHVEGWCSLIRSLGVAGVPTLGYNFRGIGNFRTESAIGRGGARYSTFDFAEFQANPQEHPDHSISEPDLRANLRLFVERIVPVAEEAGVLLTMHPDDPPRHDPLGGAARVLSSLDDFERLFDLAPSPSNAMLFCQGCVAEMGEDIAAAIRRIAGLGKIGTVHFRNIRGGPERFEEVFLDEGDMDMYAAMRVYQEVGYDGPFMLDHTPGLQDTGAGWAGRAYAIGFIRATMQAAYR